MTGSARSLRQALGIAASAALALAGVESPPLAIRDS
jgi:hypothetical protein